MAKEQKCPIANMKCPKNSDPAKGKYCPAWTEYMETNPQTGEERLQKECLFQAMPRFMIETIKAANRPAAAIESTRNEIANGMSTVFTMLSHFPEIKVNNDPNNRIEDKNNKSK